MEFTKTNEAEKPLMGRKEYMLSMKFDGSTPKGADVKKSVASYLKADEKMVIVKKIRQKFGMGDADVNVYVYHDAKNLQRFGEIQKKKALKAKRDEDLKKHKEAKAAAAKPAEPAQPAPAQ
ncbi:MAG TPA: hypothetical protein VJC07_02315 [Candidatus Nanoarchaeia archaeon]|nr:hypothetical protein [Candidatus Nanoarchaeia archaeon]